MPNPLPHSRVVLEELFNNCATCLGIIDKTAQRDQRRAKLMFRFADGEITFDELRQHGKVLEDASERARNEYKPHIETLWPYCDPARVRRAKYFLSFGGEAAAEGYIRIHQDPWFAKMVVTGYAMAARGQVMHIALLRKLQDDLVEAINRLVDTIPDKPDWNSATGKLRYQGENIRSVRGIAGRLRSVLDAFQLAGWPEWIAAPRDFNDQTLRETIKVLNRHLKGIRFRADGKGTGVIWEGK